MSVQPVHRNICGDFETNDGFGPRRLGHLMLTCRRPVADGGDLLDARTAATPRRWLNGSGVPAPGCWFRRDRRSVLSGGVCRLMVAPPAPGSRPHGGAVGAADGEPVVGLVGNREAGGEFLVGKDEALRLGGHASISGFHGMHVAVSYREGGRQETASPCVFG